MTNQTKTIIIVSLILLGIFIANKVNGQLVERKFILERINSERKVIDLLNTKSRDRIVTERKALDNRSKEGYTTYRNALIDKYNAQEVVNANEWLELIEIYNYEIEQDKRRVTPNRIR